MIETIDLPGIFHSERLLRDDAFQPPFRIETKAAERGAYGSRIASYLGLGSAPSVTVPTKRRALLAVTRVQCDVGLSEFSALIPAESAFILSLHLQAVPFQQTSQQGRLGTPTQYAPGDVSIINLETAQQPFAPLPSIACSSISPVPLWTRSPTKTAPSVSSP